LLGAFVVPLALCSIYLELTRPLPFRVNGGSELDEAVVFSCIGIGAFCLLMLPCWWLYRFLAVAVYIPGFGFIVLMYYLAYECAKAGVWL
jgi:hypothetical protein